MTEQQSNEPELEKFPLLLISGTNDNRLFASWTSDPDFFRAALTCLLDNIYKEKQDIFVQLNGLIEHIKQTNEQFFEQEKEKVKQLELNLNDKNE